MNIRVDLIQIFVSDIKKAEKWYSEVFGMKLITRCSKLKYIIMKLGTTEFCISTPIPEWGEGWDTVKIGGRTPILFETDDIKKTVKSLKQKGVKFVEALSRRPWGEYKVVFADPDGNEFGLVQLE